MKPETIILLRILANQVYHNNRNQDLLIGILSKLAGHDFATAERSLKEARLESERETERLFGVMFQNFNTLFMANQPDLSGFTPEELIRKLFEDPI